MASLHLNVLTQWFLGQIIIILLISFSIWLTSLKLWISMAWSHDMNQRWFMINDVLWHSSKGNSTKNVWDINQWNVFWNCTFKMTVISPRGQGLQVEIIITGSARLYCLNAHKILPTPLLIKSILCMLTYFVFILITLCTWHQRNLHKYWFR